VFSVVSRISVVLGVTVFHAVASQAGIREVSASAEETILPAGFRTAYVLASILCLGAAACSASLSGIGPPAAGATGAKRSPTQGSP
jgi:hypothetical protein